MRLNFPNPSRSFDPSKNAVTFWGYDSAIEVVFIVDVSALRKLVPEVGDVEAGILKAFDDETTRIHEAAEKAYKNSSGKSYACRLTIKDF